MRRLSSDCMHVRTISRKTNVNVQLYVEHACLATAARRNVSEMRLTDLKVPTSPLFIFNIPKAKITHIYLLLIL